MEVEDIILDVFWCDQPSSSRRSNCQPVTMWIVTNVWISLILLLAVAAGPGQYQSVTYPQLPPRCRCCGPSSWIFHRLYLSRCCSDARSYSLSAPLLPSALPALGHASQPLLSLEASLFRKSRKCDKRRDICGDFIQSPLLSVNTSDWVLVCPLSNAENVT